MLAMPTFAQEEDVTHLIVNPGFDSDLTFLEDGSTKEIVEKGSLSSRSHKHVAADGTIYARSKMSSEGNGNWKRNDTQYSFNGFLGQIEGWTLETASSGEWTYFGAVPYTLAPGSTTVGIADDNNNSWLTVAGKPAEANTADNKGTLYLRAGWGNYADYSQVVKLPCAQYRLEYWINNMNFANTNSDGLENHCKITCRKDVFADEEGVNANGWEKHTIEFTPTAEFTITMGFKSANRGSGTNPILLIDGMKLYKIGEADEEDLLRSDISDYIDAITEYAEDNLSDYSGVIGEIYDYVGDIDAGLDDVESMREAYQKLKAYSESMESILATCLALTDKIDEATAAADSDEQYPGIDDLSDAIEAASDLISEGTIKEIEDGVAALEKAIMDYYMSQEATPENPANFTFYIDNPTFVEQGKWYIGQDGGDQRLHTGLTDNLGDPMTAWNAWRNNLEVGSSVSISQDLVGLKNGKYTVTADLCTQDGCITDQHVFANASADDAVSPVMTQTGWDPYVWETLTTGVVIVTDGKLTIGVIGNGDGQLPSDFGGTDTDKRRGWFCVSNFKLSYLGEATEEEIAAVAAAKFASAEEMADTMHLAADKATFKAAIEAAKPSDFDALNEAIKVAQASEAEYAGIMAGTLNDLKTNIAESEDYTANAKKVAQVAVDYMNNYLGSAEATYTETGAITTVLRYYRDNLIPALIAAENTEISDATGKAALQATIADVVSALATYESDTNVLAEYVAKLNEAVQVAEAADIAYTDGSDVTGYMVNPTCDNTTGWTVNKPVGDGNGVKTGQQYDGNGNGGYIDTYNSEAGTLRATVYQVLNVPNGTYKVANMMRTSANAEGVFQGAYLFASDKAPVTTEEGDLTLDATATSVLAEAKPVATPQKYYIVAADAEPNDYKTDTHGEIWMGVADKIMAQFGITGVNQGVEATIYDLVVEANNGSEDCPAGVDAADWAIFAANSGNGRGWFNNSLEIEVKDHVLVVGATCDYKFVNKTEEQAFTGTWFSADNFVLTMVKAGDNTGWNAANAIESVESTSTTSAIYTISGARVNALQKGVNIIKMNNGSVQKVLVK